MSTSASTIRLGGEALEDHRHICALVNGSAEADALLLPFITDGLHRGDRVVRVLDPELRDAHLERLKAAGTDVSAMVASRQLEVLSWGDAYMRGGRFDRSGQLTYLRRMVAETRDLGYPITRYVGSTEWARDDATVRELLEYEARVNTIVRNQPDVYVCTYDLNHHSGQAIADALNVHSAAIVGGVLRASETAPASARERLIATASQLFHEAGIQATGVDSIISAAGVAKATFYRHFPSKDDLVVAWLSGEQTNWLADVRQVAEARASSAEEVIPLLFDAAAEWFEVDDFRGCPYLNASVEITNERHPALPEVRAFLDHMAAQLGEVAAAARLPDPERLGLQLKILLVGAITQALAYRSIAPFETAREAAVDLVRSGSSD